MRLMTGRVMEKQLQMKIGYTTQTKYPASKLCSHCYPPDRLKDGFLVTDKMYVVNNQSSQNKGKRLGPETIFNKYSILLHMKYLYKKILQKFH
jgi:heterodisulfide reductase subunit B